MLWEAAEEVFEPFTCSGFNSSFLSIFTRPRTSCSFLGLEAEVLKYWDKLFLWFLETGWNQEGWEIGRPALSGFSLSRRQELGLGTLDHVSTPTSKRPVKDLILAAASLFNDKLITILLTSFFICKWEEMSLTGDNADIYFLITDRFVYTLICLFSKYLWCTYSMSPMKSPDRAYIPMECVLL